MNLYQFINFSEAEDDAYLESYGNHQPTKEEIKEEKRARRHEKMRRWWNTYGDAVKLGALTAGGIAVAGLGAHALGKGMAPIAAAMKEKAAQRSQAKAEKDQAKFDNEAWKRQQKELKEQHRHEEALTKRDKNWRIRQAKAEAKQYQTENKRRLDDAKYQKKYGRSF